MTKSSAAEQPQSQAVKELAEQVALAKQVRGVNVNAPNAKLRAVDRNRLQQWSVFDKAAPCLAVMYRGSWDYATSLIQLDAVGTLSRTSLAAAERRWRRR